MAGDDENQSLKENCRQVGEAFASICPEGVGFCLLMFKRDEAGTMVYTSNVGREDMIKLIKDLVEKMS